MDSPFSPSPLVGEGGRDAQHRGRVRGLSPRIETPHPPSRSAKAPSPTRGEGKKAPIPLDHCLLRSICRADVASPISSGTSNTTVRDTRVPAARDDQVALAVGKIEEAVLVEMADACRAKSRRAFCPPPARIRPDSHVFDWCRILAGILRVCICVRPALLTGGRAFAWPLLQHAARAGPHDPFSSYPLFRRARLLDPHRLRLCVDHQYFATTGPPQR